MPIIILLMIIVTLSSSSPDFFFPFHQGCSHRLIRNANHSAWNARIGSSIIALRRAESVLNELYIQSYYVIDWSAIMNVKILIASSELWRLPSVLMDANQTRTVSLDSTKYWSSSPWPSLSHIGWHCVGSHTCIHSCCRLSRDELEGRMYPSIFDS